MVDELKEKGFQVERIECIKTQRQEEAGDVTEMHTEQYDWNILCVWRNGKTPNPFG